MIWRSLIVLARMKRFIEWFYLTYLILKIVYLGWFVKEKITIIFQKKIINDNYRIQKEYRHISYFHYWTGKTKTDHTSVHVSTAMNKFFFCFSNYVHALLIHKCEMVTLWKMAVMDWKWIVWVDSYLPLHFLYRSVGKWLWSLQVFTSRCSI